MEDINKTRVYSLNNVLQVFCHKPKWNCEDHQSYYILSWGGMNVSTKSYGDLYRRCRESKLKATVIRSNCLGTTNVYEGLLYTY